MTDRKFNVNLYFILSLILIYCFFTILPYLILPFIQIGPISHSITNDTILTMISTNGIVEWQKRFDGHLSPIYVSRDNSGGFYMYGGITTPNESKQLSSLFAARLLQNGDIAWEFIKDPMAYYSDGLILEAAVSGSQTANKYIVTDNKLVIQLNNIGKELWHRTYGGEIHRSISTNDGGYILFGSMIDRERTKLSYPVGWIIRIDSNGNKVWEYINSSFDSFERISATSDGSFQFLGNVRSNSSLQYINGNPDSYDNKFLLTIIDNNGNLVSIKPLTNINVSNFENIEQSRYSNLRYESSLISAGKISVNKIYDSNSIIKQFVINSSNNSPDIGRIDYIYSVEDGYLVFAS